MSNKLNIAIIGAGGMAQEHIKAFQAFDGVTIGGIYSRTLSNAQKLARMYNIPISTDNISELLSFKKFDLLIVAISVEASHGVLCEALKYGIPVLTEKPIGLDLAESNNIVKLAKEASTPLWVGLNRRCYSATQMALDGLKDDSNPRFIEVHDQQDKRDAVALNFHESVVDNWMYANSIHLVDYVRTFGRGDIVDVQVTDHWIPDATSCLVAARVFFGSGDVAHYKAAWGMPGPWACVVTTADNRWEMRPLETVKVQKSGTRVSIDLPIDDVDTNYKSGLYLQAADVIDAVRSNRSPDHVPDGDEALIVTRLVSQIYNIEQ